MEPHLSPPDDVQAVKVAVHIRPLIASELLQGCKDCVSLSPGEPQVHIGNHSFTFDHVYGSTGSPSSSIFDECVLALVEGAFQGYNATVLAYGQTGSGKTYTMGTGYTVGGSTDGVIPQVMHTIFNKVSALKEKSEIRIRVAFIEILKEEVHDLLDPNPPIPVKSDATNCGVKAGPIGRPPIQIRENTNGEITLAGVTEVDVGSLEEMAACLERGSLCRATASTNMNSRSSRSHAIFTIILEQKCIIDSRTGTGVSSCDDDVTDDFLCAKLHLVDLAGSERAKRTGADGVRFKEGVHINKGLLALGNVISALGDDKKRKEGGHVPYRDSKLTRLLQDSLGGNSRTVMIACISPADSNAEETLNTLKYANRARNIQNKPVVNRDPVAAEMQRMRQQMELLQAELLCVREGGSFEEMQILKQRIVFLETSLLELQQELKAARQDLHLGAQRLLETQVEKDQLLLKLGMIQSGKSWEDVCGGDSHQEYQNTLLLESYAERIKALETEVHQLRNDASEALRAGEKKYQRTMFVHDNDSPILDLGEGRGIKPSDIEEETVAKEMEHARLQDSLDKELEELNKRLEQKEAEMKSFAKSDGVILKHHFEKKIVELEEEKKVLQNERDTLLSELTRLSNASDEQSQKLQETYLQKVKALETQILELKKKQENQSNLLKQKQRSEEAAKRLQEEIQRIKSQKVQLQNKIKQESEQFRTWKALREKEVLQLKKEGRRNEFEMHKLQALHQRQKMVLQRKTEECAAATRRLNELLESRKASSRDNLAIGATTGAGLGRQMNCERNLQQSIDEDLEVALRIHEVRSNHKKQSETRAALAKELQKLRQEQDVQERKTETYGSLSTMSPGARQAKINLLESMLNESSSTLVPMASQLSEAEERERAFSGRGRWQHLRSMAEAKNLLQYVFSSAAEARCRSWDREVECKDMKEKVSELTVLLKQSEAHLQEINRQQLAKEQHMAKMVASAAKLGTVAAMRNCFDEISKSLLRDGEIAPRQLEFPDDSECEEPSRTRKKSESVSDNGSEPDVTDVSEVEESDMDIDIDDDASDEDWRPSKDKARRSKGGKSQDVIQKQKASCDSEIKSKSDIELCCSCGRTSGCKTNKCACKAAGTTCGVNCQCSSQKCANREPSAEVAEALEMLNLNKEIRHAQTSQSNEVNNEMDEVLKKVDVQRAEQVLVKHGVDVLENALADEPERTDFHSLSRVQQESHPEKRQIRRPLSDIGNYTQVEESDGQPKLKQRKRWTKGPVQTVTVQLVPTTEPVQNENRAPEEFPESNASSIPLPTWMPSAADGTGIGRDSEMECSMPPPKPPITAPSQFTVGLYRDRQHHIIHDRKVHRQSSSKLKSSPPSSPLRARNVHATEEASSLNKKFPETSGSPRPPGKGILREKENL